MPRERRDSACSRLVALVDELAASAPSPDDLLTELGRQAAGVRPGAIGLFDLALGGRNKIRGTGFGKEFDDHTAGQVRHFIGVAASTRMLGANATRWTSEHVRRDAATSPDGLLAEAGITFATELLDGSLAVADASAWVEHNLCGGHALRTPSGGQSGSDSEDAAEKTPRRRRWRRRKAGPSAGGR